MNAPLGLALLLLSSGQAGQAGQSGVVLFDAKTQQPIVVGAQASAATREAAALLREQLGRMRVAERSGALDDVITGDGARGIAIGVSGELPGAPRVALEDPLRDRERYVLRSHKDGIFVVAADAAGLRGAVWELLHRLGHRQFFPGALWEEVPQLRVARVDVDVDVRPAYAARRLFFGYGGKPDAALRDWFDKNRVPGAVELSTGHVYDAIIKRHRAVFDAHPEYLALVDGARKGSKLCLSNPAVRSLVVDDAVAVARGAPPSRTLSMEPSDGGGWCSCDVCAGLGSPSDRAVGIANDVAARVPERLVALYAYNEHAAPPQRVKPAKNLVVNVATRFRRGQSVDGLLRGWREAGAQHLGVREYLGVHAWSKDLPGKSLAGSPRDVAARLRAFHRQGVQYVNAESTDAWAVNGPGHLVFARAAVDVDVDADAVVEDLVVRGFRGAEAPMRRFYAALFDAPRVSRDLVGALYRALDDARAAAKDDLVRRRVDALVGYVRYVELHRLYAAAAGPARQAAFERLLRFGWTLHDTRVIDATALWRDLPKRDRSVSLPKDAGHAVADDKNPWKQKPAKAKTASAAALLRDGKKNNPARGFDVVRYAAPRDKPSLAVPTPQKTDTRGRGPRQYRTWVDAAADVVTVEVTGGLLRKDRGAVTIELRGARGAVEDRAVVAPDNVPRDVTLRATSAGAHVVAVADAGGGSRVEPRGPAASVWYVVDAEAAHLGRRSAWFYVPKTATVVGGYAHVAQCTVVDPDGATRAQLAGAPDHFRVDVAKRHRGALWRLKDCIGTVELLTVPPFLASAGHLPRIEAPAAAGEDVVGGNDDDGLASDDGDDDAAPGDGADDEAR